MPAWLAPAIISGLSGLSGLLANRGRQQDTKSSWSSTSTSMPQEDPRFANLFQSLMSRYMSSLDTKPFMQGYEAQGLQGVNEAYGSVQQALANRMAAAGLYGGPMGEAANLNIELGRAGAGAKFLQGLPLLEEELMRQRLGDATKFWALQPRGTTTTQSGRGTNIQNLSGNMLGGGATSALDMLSYLYGLGMFDKGSASAPKQTAHYVWGE